MFAKAFVSKWIVLMFTLSLLISCGGGTSTTTTGGNNPNPPLSDTTQPSITISFPSNNQTFITSSITVTGTASDNATLSKVEVKLNNDPYQNATGTTPWSKSVNLTTAGTNTIYAKATDTSNNSKEVLVTITYTPVTIESSRPVSSDTSG